MSSTPPPNRSVADVAAGNGGANRPDRGTEVPDLAIPGIPLDRPELHVAAAFAGGVVLATVLKRLVR